MTRLILAAGMPRSGSTWLYNALRLLLDGSDFLSGWIDNIPDIRAGTILVKLHGPSELADRADLIFTTHRPLEDVSASLARIGWSNKGADMQAIAAQRTYWAPRSSLDISFSEILDTPAHTVTRIADVLGIEPRDIADELLALKEPMAGYDPVTLLHAGHRTARYPGVQGRITSAGKRRL